MIIELNKTNSTLKIRCDNCQNEYISLYEKNKNIPFLKEFNAYQNYTLEPCTNCNTFTVINLNVPLNELEESFFEENNMGEMEKNQRRIIKEVYGELNFESKI